MGRVHVFSSVSWGSAPMLQRLTKISKTDEIVYRHEQMANYLRRYLSTAINNFIFFFHKPQLTVEKTCPRPVSGISDDLRNRGFRRECEEEVRFIGGIGEAGLESREN